LPLRVLALMLVLATVNNVVARDFRGNQLIAFRDFAGFERSAATNSTECVLMSQLISTDLAWTELIPSWNLSPRSTALKVEVRGLYDKTATPFYTLGLWATSTNLHPRRSVANQQDEWGTVRTDTLALKRPCTAAQLRLTFPNASEVAGLKFFSLCFSDPSKAPEPLPSSRGAWGKLIPVPERSQMDYPKGEELCSPATLSMLLSFYAQQLNRPYLDKSVPEIQAAVYDDTWGGTGNWSFNTAYAGSLPGLLGCVTRFSDVTEIEDWIACGFPVGLSVCYNKLRGREGPPSGHLVVCVGFTEDGNPVINDPGTSRHVRKTFKRENLLKAWEHSHHTVYLVYPEDLPPPRDRFGHWPASAGAARSNK
jgi:hypothetical protein